MARLPDLVRDSKLETQILDGYVVHTYYESDPVSRKRAVPRLEHWRRRRLIGEGSYGSVWMEECIKGQRDVQVRAVKKISALARQHAKPIDYNRELEAIAKFSHPNYERCFVKAFGWFGGHDVLYIAMEYLELGDLQHYLRQSPALPESEAGDISFQILEGLAFMHENGFAHRDLKPANILLKSKPPDEWWVKIGDFGISKRVEDEQGVSNTLKGTLGFIAPELHGFTKTKDDYAPDLWALGEVTFQMITKLPAFKNMGLLHNYTQDPSSFPSVTLRLHNVSDSALDFILSTMNPLPEKRITADLALNHPWVESYKPEMLIPTSSLQNHRASLDVDSLSEQLGEWTVFTSGSDSQAPLASQSTDEEAQESFSSDPQTQIPRAISQPTQDRFPHSIDPVLHAQTIRQNSQPARDIFSERLDTGHSEQTIARLPTPRLIMRDRIPWRFPQTENMMHKKHMYTFRHHVSEVFCVAFSPDGRTIAFGAGAVEHGSSVYLWGIPPVRLARQLEGREGNVFSVAFSPVGGIVAYCRHSSFTGGEVLLSDTATGRPLRQFDGHTEGGASLAFSPDGSTIATGGSWDGALRLWNTATGQQLWQATDGRLHIDSVAFSPDGNIIASGGYGAAVVLSDAATGQELGRFLGEVEAASAVAFSPDGRTLASWCPGRTGVWLWDIVTGQVRQELLSANQLQSVAFSPDGGIIACAGQVVQLWDTATCQPLLQLDGHAGPVNSVAFSPVHRILACGGYDRTVRLWDITW